MSKILEIIMFKRLEQHLESNNILTTKQFGFRKGVHIENAVFSLTDFTKPMTTGRGYFLRLNQGIRLRQPHYSFKRVTLLWNQREMSLLV
jgi:hypothetical protein